MTIGNEMLSPPARMMAGSRNEWTSDVHGL
jgi:hypothetical protein